MTETAADRFPNRALSSSLSMRSRPWSYAARPGSDVALERLVTLLRSGATRIAIEGAPGAGKTLLLHVLPERLGASFASAYLPHPGLDPAGVRAWLQNFAGPLPADAGSTFEDLAFSYARRGPGLVLLIDDANAMPEAIAREFGALLERTGDAVRIVVAGVPNANLEAVLKALGGRAARVRIGESRAPSEPFDTREGALSQLLRAPSESAPSETLEASAESHAPSTPSPAIEPESARAHTPPASSVAGPPPRPAEAQACPPAETTERLHATESTAGGTERGTARTARSASAPALPPLPRPSRAPWLRAAGIAGVLAAATAALVLLFLRSDTRNELPEVASAPPAVALPTQPPPPVAVAPPVPVHVNARPWARIFVDGRELGVTPLGNVPLEPGLRQFRAELADGRVVEREVRVEIVDQKVTFP